MEEAKRLDAIPSLFHGTFAAFCVIGTMRSLSEAPPSLKVRKSANAPLESGIVRAWPAVTFGRPQILAHAPTRALPTSIETNARLACGPCAAPADANVGSLSQCRQSSTSPCQMRQQGFFRVLVEVQQVH
jgi:hypothetical protein